MTQPRESDALPCVRCSAPTRCTWGRKGEELVGLCTDCFGWVLEEPGQQGERIETIDALAYGMEER